MSDQRLPPSDIILQTNLTGSLSDIQDDPDSPDSNWLTAPNNVTTVLLVNFDTPDDDLQSGTDTQEFRVLVRKTATNNDSSTDTVTVYLYEAGVQVGAA